MNKTAHIFFTLWVIIAGSMGSPQPCFADSPVTLRGETDVRQMTVKLSDVFTGVPAEIDRDIAQAPPPGKQVSYDVNVLTRLANKYRLDWHPQTLADHVLITSACRKVTADMIREAVIQRVKNDRTIFLEKSSEIDVGFDNHALEIDLPADQSSNFSLNNFDYDPTSKQFHTDIVASTTSGPFAVPVSGRITIKRSVPVLVKRLESGTVISVADLDWMMVPEERVNASVITDVDQLVGHELHRAIDEGEMLHAHDIIPPRLVTRGSLVTLKIETPFMSLTTQGRALQDGTDGEVVRVMNTQSNRMIEGKVSGPGTVLVQATQVMAAVQ